VIAAIARRTCRLGLEPELAVFWPHPRELLHGRAPAKALICQAEKLALLGPVASSKLVLVPFTHRGGGGGLAALTPEAFR